MSKINQAKVERIVAEAARITRAYNDTVPDWKTGYAIMDGAEDQATDLAGSGRFGRVTQKELTAVYAALRVELAPEIAIQREAFNARKRL
jgi:Flp pilus assembly protein TadG